MKSNTFLSYLFYFIFWMSGVIYASINKTDIKSEMTYLVENSFERNFKLGKKLRDVSYVIPTQHLPEITVTAKLPRSGEKLIAENKSKKANTVISQPEESIDEYERQNLINLIKDYRIEVELPNLTKYLPTAKIDSKATDRHLIEITV